MLNKQEEIEVYSYYIGEVVPGSMYNSIIPDREDQWPSFGLYKSLYKEDKILWKDFGLNQKGHDALALIQHMEGLGTRQDAETFYRQSIKGSKSIGLVSTEYNKCYPELHSRTYFKDYEIEYWAKRYVHANTLFREKIYPVQTMTVQGHVFYESTADDPCFEYKFGQDSWKAYRPLAQDKTDKWRTKNIVKVIEGLDTVPDAYPSLIIASSTKDRLAWKQFHPCVVNPPSENSLTELLKHTYDFNLRYMEIVCIFDADLKGIAFARKLEQLSTGIVRAVDAREFTPCFLKDADDLIVRYGPSKIYNVLKDLELCS